MVSEESEKFDAYVDDELSAEARAAFEQALSADGALRADFDDFHDSIRLLRDLPEEAVPDRFLQLVQQRVRKRTRGRHFNHYRQPSMVVEAAACAVLVFATAALYILGIDAHKPPPPNAAATERVLLAPADTRFLNEFGQIYVVATSITGTDLEVHMTIPAAQEEPLRDALTRHTRLDLVPTSLHRRDGQVWLKVRAPAGPRTL